MNRIAFYIILNLFPFFTVTGQQTGIDWQFQDQDNPAYNEINLPDKLDSGALEPVLTQVLRDVRFSGYLSANISHYQVTDSVVSIPFYLGPLYTWISLHPGNLPNLIAGRSGYREKMYDTRPVQVDEMRKAFENILEYSDNHGHPFASVTLDSVEITETTVRASIFYDPGPLITFDSLQIEGEVPVKPQWLMAHLGLRQGEPYDQSVVDMVEKHLSQLPYLKQNGPVQLTFQNEEATLTIPLAPVSANTLDGVVGFLPNEENDGGLRVTGQLNLSLANLFGSGKSLDLVWQRIKPLSQTLNIRYRHPDIFYSPLHVEGAFELLKEDTTYINREFQIQFDYEPGPHQISFFSRFKTTRLISTYGMESVMELPDISDLNVNYYGLGYRYTDRRTGWAGNRGFDAGVRTAIGDKKIRQNPGLPQEIYNGLDLRTVQFTLQGDAHLGIPIGKRALFFQKASGGIIRDDQLFLNDLYRVGGFRSIRGFNENEFFASDYMIYTMEYQLYYEQNAYLFVFIDQGYMKNKLPSAGTTDHPTGIGAGLTISTNAGVLEVAYALGRTSEQPFNFSLSKFHFGYIAKF